MKYNFHDGDKSSNSVNYMDSLIHTVEKDYFSKKKKNDYQSHLKVADIKKERSFGSNIDG
jgi:hypothetical protein